MLGPAQRIDDLNLSHNVITDVGCAALCRAMLTNLTLTIVDLSFNRIGPGGAASLGRMLQQNQRLISVDLANNSIGTPQGSSLRVYHCVHALVCTCQPTDPLLTPHPTRRHRLPPATTGYHRQATLASRR